jgi:hypothetical protein
MWRADDVRDSVGDGHFGHLDRGFEGVRAVVQAWKDVAMDVDHAFLLTGTIPEHDIADNR